MTTLLRPAALAVAVLLGGAVDVLAWERTGGLIGPRGHNSFAASGECASRACTREATATGARGRTLTRLGDRSCADGACAGSRTATGPNGEAVTRTFSFSR